MGYAYLNERSLAPVLPTAELPAPRASPPLIYHRKWSSTPFASDSELAVDIILNETLPTATTVWSNTKNASTGAYIDSVSHLKGDSPAGANALCFDGHVGWRPYGFGKFVSVQVSGSSGTPFFVFLNP